MDPYLFDFLFLDPVKNPESRAFLIFSGGIKRGYSEEMEITNNFCLYFNLVLKICSWTFNLIFLVYFWKILTIKIIIIVIIIIIIIIITSLNSSLLILCILHISWWKKIWFFWGISFPYFRRSQVAVFILIPSDVTLFTEVWESRLLGSGLACFEVFLNVS